LAPRPGLSGGVWAGGGPWFSAPRVGPDPGDALGGGGGARPRPGPVLGVIGPSS
jgi:hypothetical protein